DPLPDPIRTEIEPRIALRARCVTGEQPDDDERQDDGGRGSEQIERERQRQVVALAEAVGLRRACERAQGPKEEDGGKGYAAGSGGGQILSGQIRKPPPHPSPATGGGGGMGLRSVLLHCRPSCEASRGYPRSNRVG